MAVVAAAWMVPTLGSLAGGMDRADSLWYHMPLATRFAHGSHFGAVDYFDPIFFASFYPANSEVVHATGILAFDRDILSPLLNLGWLALGPDLRLRDRPPLRRRPAVADRRRDRAGSPEPRRVPGGRGAERHRRRGDDPGVRGDARERLGRRGSERRVDAVRYSAARSRVAGLAAGLAAGTKLSFLAPVIALFFGLVVIAPKGAE